ncbi:hypothetical protein E5Q_06018 [Mixia osmundae IAM 14324]|uniref:SPX domain-containing protein n=1 Tax=Mixia osmundae (strain CBS 9802 / IAM 14324 / JCM 22182 / KY 12970) TaxID=764103 RepID=G7E9K4_MIXOS|nr:hypothetical protein E5Q_06018 [Mixia osmundae IAM 14324]
MKFSHYLSENVTEEWRREYINYRKLKKLIKLARRASDTPLLADRHSERYFDRTSGDPEACREGANDSESDDHEYTSSRSYAWSTGEHSSEYASRRPPSTLGSNMQRSSTAVSGVTDDGRPSESQDASETSMGNSRTELRPRQSEQATLVTESPPMHYQHRDRSERRSIFGEQQPQIWRYPRNSSLDSLYGAFTSAERNLFSVLDRDLLMVNDFFADRLHEAEERLRVLRMQLEELSHHKHDKRDVTYATMHSSKSLQDRKTIKGSNKVATSSAAYRSARATLRSAAYELYRLLNLIKSYKLLNLTGFSKIVKKAEKVLAIPCAQPYMAKVDATPLRQSTRLERLIQSTEDLFARHFEHGSRKLALERLRDEGNVTPHHISTFRAGAFLGLAVPALVAGLIKSFHPDTRAAIPEWVALMQLFGAELLPILLALLFAVNLAVWQRYRINYVLVFELDVRTMIDYRQYLEIPAFAFLLLCYAFWLSFSNFWPNHISPHSYPLAWLIAIIIAFCNPLPLLHRTARAWLARSVGRAFTFGIYPVQFRDFWIADELVSLYYVFYNFGYIVCTYQHHFTRVPPKCNTNDTMLSFVLAAIPPLMRIGQCTRRYVDSREKMHIANIVKYLLNSAYFASYFVYRVYANERRTSAAFILWVIISIINSAYSSYWDIAVDWSLLKRHSKHWLLRPELGYKTAKWFYYWAMISNIILRFSWVLYFATPVRPSVILQSWLVALLEMLRRWQWNFLRVEAEAVGNSDGYRVSRDIPLPYHISAKVKQEDEAESGDEDIGVAGKVLDFFNLRPAADSSGSLKLLSKSIQRKSDGDAHSSTEEDAAAND